MRLLALVLTILVLAQPDRCAAADGVGENAKDRAGVFDYYVLAMSWNAAWCEAEGDRRGAAQCEPQHEIGFSLHGLWPQYEYGWPEFCARTQSDPTRGETAAMVDLMHSPGLAWYQWKKHGRCSGLDPADYFALSRTAWESIRRPALLRQVEKPMRLAPNVIEQAFIEANPALRPDGVTVTCKDRMIREVRICLTRDLAPRPCGAKAARDCSISGALFVPMR